MNTINIEQPTEEKTMEKQIDRLYGANPSQAVSEAVGRALAKNIFNKSRSHLNFIEDLKRVCDVMTKTISDLQDQILSENPTIKIAVLVADPAGLLTIV